MAAEKYHRPGKEKDQLSPAYPVLEANKGEVQRHDDRDTLPDRPLTIIYLHKTDSGSAQNWNGYGWITIVQPDDAVHLIRRNESQHPQDGKCFEVKMDSLLSVNDADMYPDSSSCSYKRTARSSNKRDRTMRKFLQPSRVLPEKKLFIRLRGEKGILKAISAQDWSIETCSLFLTQKPQHDMLTTVGASRPRAAPMRAGKAHWTGSASSSRRRRQPRRKPEQWRRIKETHTGCFQYAWDMDREGKTGWNLGCLYLPKKEGR